MNNEYREMYENIQVSDERKREIRKNVFSAYENKKAKRKKQVMRLSVAVALTLVLLCTTSIVSYNTVAATVVYDSEAKVELQVNCFDQVIGVNGMNESGETAAGCLNLKGHSYGDAVDKLCQYEEESFGAECLNEVKVDVDCNSENRLTRMKENIETCTNHHRNRVQNNQEVECNTEKEHNQQMECTTEEMHSQENEMNQGTGECLESSEGQQHESGHNGRKGQGGHHE